MSSKNEDEYIKLKFIVSNATWLMVSQKSCEGHMKYLGGLQDVYSKDKQWYSQKNLNSISKWATAICDFSPRTQRFKCSIEMNLRNKEISIVSSSELWFGQYSKKILDKVHICQFVPLKSMHWKVKRRFYEWTNERVQIKQRSISSKTK